MIRQNTFKVKTDEFIQLVYQLTINFPKHELYGLVSQLRRAAVSIMLNYIEGFARKKIKVRLNFLEISYGSLRECKYILYLSQKLNYITLPDYTNLYNLVEEIGAILWKTIETTEKNINNT